MARQKCTFKLGGKSVRLNGKRNMYKARKKCTLNKARKKCTFKWQDV